MYSRKLTALRVAEAGKKLGFTLEYHELGHIQQQIKRLNEIVGDDGRLVRPLRDDETQWIMNERMVAKLDFRYYSERYAWILHYEGGEIVRFHPNVAQNIVLDVWGELEEKLVAIMLLILKARQHGISTLTELAVAHRTQFYPHTNSLVASSDPDKSRKMADMMDRCWENNLWWMMPKQTAYRAGTLVEFGEMDSGVSIQHGAQFTGLGRGSTPNVAHLSEVAEFIDPEELIDASLLNAMHPSPKMFIILESTAKGRKNYWHRLWEYSKQNYKSGKASFYPMFLPWFVGRDIYPTETWLRMHPIPEEYEPATLTYHHAERAKSYVHSNELLSKFLGKEWEMPVEQMWWWEVTRDEYKDKDILSKFYEEMPADDFEAFQSTNRSAFDADTLSRYRENVREPLAIFGFRGKPDEVPVRMQPDRRDINFNQPMLTIRSRWNPSMAPFECQLIPLKFRGYPALDQMGKLILWEMPEDNEQYGLGVDTGDGVGLDRSAIEVLRKGTIERSEAQVAEFMSPYIGAFDLWPLCMAVGTLFSTEFNGQMRQAKMVIDCLKNGENVQFELKKRGWYHFHDWLRYDKKRIRASDSHRQGWFSNGWARAMMMDLVIKAIRDEWIDIASPYFVDEMGDLERDEYRQSLKAAHGGHDDLIISLGMLYFSLHILEIRGNERMVATQRKARSQMEFIDPVYTPAQQAQDLPRDWSTLAELDDRLSLYEPEDA